MSTTDSLQENFIINVGSKTNIEAAIQSGDITADMLSIVTDEDYYANVDLSNLSATGQTIINNKQDTLVSGTNIKTINGSSILGAGNIDVDGLPSQTGQSGKFLTTDGSSASWATVSAGDPLPDQTGQSGKILTTDGTDASWTDDYGVIFREWND